MAVPVNGPAGAVFDRLPATRKSVRHHHRQCRESLAHPESGVWSSGCTAEDERIPNDGGKSIAGEPEIFN